MKSLHPQLHDKLAVLLRIPSAVEMARLPSLKGTDRKSPSGKPSGGVLAFLHRLRPDRATGVNRVANRDPSTSRPSLDAHNAWQAISETSGSEDTKVRSAHTCCCASKTR